MLPVGWVPNAVLVLLLVAMIGVRVLIPVGALFMLSLVACGGGSAPVSDARTDGDGQAHPTTVSLKAGDPAPLFSLPASDGKVYDLASYRGKQAVVLAWFVKAFTEP